MYVDTYLNCKSNTTSHVSHETTSIQHHCHLKLPVHKCRKFQIFATRNNHLRTVVRILHHLHAQPHRQKSYMFDFSRKLTALFASPTYMLTGVQKYSSRGATECDKTRGLPRVLSQFVPPNNNIAPRFTSA